MALPSLFDRKRGRGLAMVAALTLVQGGAAGAAAFATRGLFEAMHLGTALPVLGLAVLIGAGAVIATTRVTARHVGERIGQDYSKQIRAALFEHAARMPAPAVAERRTGYMSLRFVGDMTAFRNWLGLGLPRLIAGCALIPATLAVLWFLDPVFALVVLPVIAVTLVLIALGGFRLVPLQRRLRAGRARIAADMAERMPLAPHLDRLGRRGKELALLDKRTDAMVTAALRHRLAAESLKALPDLAAGIAAALVILAGHRAGLGTGSIAGAIAALGLLLSPLRDLGGVWDHWSAFRVAAIKAEGVLSRAQREQYRSDQSLPEGPVEVLFENVAMPSGNLLNSQVERGANVDLPVSELDAEGIMGLLLGLDVPISGRILLSGIDLCDLSRGSLRRGVLRVGTAPEILQGSLRKALLMGYTKHQDDATLEGIARDEGLGPLIDRLRGLDGTVREGGKNLTRSERVAICLVRMRLLRPRLVLLDLDIEIAARTRINASLKSRGATVIRLMASNAAVIPAA